MRIKEHRFNKTSLLIRFDVSFKHITLLQMEGTCISSTREVLSHEYVEFNYTIPKNELYLQISPDSSFVIITISNEETSHSEILFRHKSALVDISPKPKKEEIYKGLSYNFPSFYNRGQSKKIKNEFKKS